MIDMTKLGMTGFGTAYQSPQAMYQQNANPTDNSRIYNAQQKTSVTQKPDGTTSQSTTTSGGTPMYNPNPQLPEGYTGYQQPQGMTNAQNAWQSMINSGGGMADTTPWMNSFMEKGKYTIQDAINQAMQVGNRAGMGNSSPMQRMQGNIGAKYWADIMPQMLETQMNQYNQGANRYLQAASGLENNAMNQQGLAQNWSNNAMNMANLYQQQQQGMLGNYQQELQRMYAENNPYYGLAAQGFNANNQVGPIQYNPSFLTSMLGLVPSVVGGAGMAGGFGKLFS